MNIRRLHDGCIDELMGLAFELLVQTKIVVFPPQPLPDRLPTTDPSCEPYSNIPAHKSRFLHRP